MMSMRAARVNMLGGGGDACPPAVTPRKSLLSTLLHSHMGSLHRPLSIGFGCLCVAALLLYTHISSRRQLVYSNNSRLTARAFSGAMGTYDCIPADALIGGELGPNGNGTASKKRLKKIAAMRRAAGFDDEDERAIPMVATNLDHDTEKYLSRFVQGLDYPIKHKLVVWGGCDPMVADEVDWILETFPDVLIYRARTTLGCANGWNQVLRYMSMHEDVPWAIVFNSDMYTPPGSLSAFSREIWRVVDEDPRFCLGFFNTQGAGSLGRYTSYVYTRHALNTLGLFDGNIYPAYYEDIELDIRFARAVESGICSPLRTFNSSMFEHGYKSKKYLSGSKIVQQVMASYGDEYFKQVAREWSEKIKRGKLSSPLYLRDKWGCRSEEHIRIEDCHFARPFNDPENPLSYWTFDAERRRCIDESRDIVACAYTLRPPAPALKGGKSKRG